MSLLIRFIFLLVLVCTISCRDRNEEQSMDSQMNRIENETRLSFPTNSRLDHFVEFKAFVDPEWVAKVIVPASSYENLREILLAKSPDNTDDIDAIVDSISWWKPANVVLTKQYLDSGNTIVKVVVSKDDEEYAVYIECVVF